MTANIIRYLVKKNIDISKEQISNFESTMKITLPVNFKELLIKYSGITYNFEKLEKFENEYDELPCSLYYKGEVEVDIINFNKNILDENYHLEKNKNYKIKEKLIYFGDDGAGRYLCLDYTNILTNGDVPIIILMPDEVDEYRGIYVADNFDALLEMIGNKEKEINGSFITYKSGDWY